MAKQKANIRDIRLDAFIGEQGIRYRATHIPSGVYSESISAVEAVDAVNDGLEESTPPAKRNSKDRE